MNKLPSQVERVYMDPRMVEEISRDPQMLAEQGGSGVFLQDWGGPEVYKAMASMDDKARITYAAFLQGADTVTAVADMTGLDAKDISKSLGPLEKKGFLQKDSIFDDTKEIVIEGIPI